ncbi:hypothetical protein JOD97_002627 [Duganella sp. 1411]|uniref:hypothetical protein n=1 Tax=Duganella sp. 1411 TaxID=2806572 RepID=UPI001AE5D4DF|nr:hypothetical protein [Duganella sp. 1411]MBP1204585.1 hypothetical protein [Duganella sp. 1411]
MDHVDEWEVPSRLEGVGRYGHVLFSLAAHALLIVLLYYFGVHRVQLARQSEQVDRQVSAGAALAKRSSVEKRVQDMAKIKDLLDQSRPGAPPSDGAGAVDEPDFSATSLPTRPERLLAQARELSASIAEIEKDLKAAELARIQKIPREQARKLLDAPPPNATPLANGAPPADSAPPPNGAPRANAAPPPNGAPPANGAPGQLAAEIERLETEARAALLRRQQDLAQRQDGVAVTTDASSGEQSGTAPDQEGGGGGAGRIFTGPNDGLSVDGERGMGAIARRMAAFINRDVVLPTGTVRNYSRPGEAIFNPGIGQIPPVDAHRMTKGVGRVLGRGGEFANRVYVNSWYLIGPFDGKHGKGLFSNHRHPPEQGVVLDAAYVGKGGRLLKWRYVSAASYPLVPPDPDEDAVYYGYTELMMDRDQDLTLWLGADDDAQVWVNDAQVWAGGNINKLWFWNVLYDVPNTHARDLNMTEGLRKVHFRKGRNKIFFKMANGPTRLFFSLVLTK